MKDYTKYSFYITLLVVVILLGIGMIPPITVGGVKLKRANIISDIYKYDDQVQGEREIEISDSDRAFIEEMEREKEQEQEGKEEQGLMAEESWTIGEQWIEANYGEREVEGKREEVNGREDGTLVKIENYSEESAISITDFCGLLGSATSNRVVRMGVLGDSYVEGDIITADIRQQLQQRYGGGGVGFVPFETPLAANRPTVKHTFSGWKNYNLIYKKNAPEELQDKYYISGVVSVPKKDAWTRYESANFRRNLGDVYTARLLFTNTQQSKIHLVVNDTIERVFTPRADPMPQQINVSGVKIKSVQVEVENPEGFYGYGVVMESRRGVSVDNYSIRGNSGLALFGTSQSVNRTIDRALGYDLIVLQYGLNIMEAEVTGYKSYGEQLRRIIRHIKSSFPRAAILVMGVGDRCMQEDGEFVTMPAVEGMIKEQRAVAKECGVAFWSIYDVMAKYGGMMGFVEKGWAAKDYTHLNYAGGRKIADEFVKALEFVRIYSAEDQMEDYGTGGERGEVESLSSASVEKEEESEQEQNEEEIKEDADSTLLKKPMERKDSVERVNLGSGEQSEEKATEVSDKIEKRGEMEIERIEK